VLARACAGGMPARPNRRLCTAPHRLPGLSSPPRSGLRRDDARPKARGPHDSTPIVEGRVRRKRQRLGPNGSIESDPAVNVRAPGVRPRAGSLPIESYRLSGVTTKGATGALGPLTGFGRRWEMGSSRTQVEILEEPSRLGERQGGDDLVDSRGNWTHGLDLLHRHGHVDLEPCSDHGFFLH
jgi:hypothetical protein